MDAKISWKRIIIAQCFYCLFVSKTRPSIFFICFVLGNKVN